MQTELFIDGKWVAPVAGGTLPVIDPATEAVHRRLKKAFDPDGLFNPGRLYPWI